MIQYNNYVYERDEKIRYGMMGGLASFLLFMLFYDNVFLCIFLAIPSTIIFLRYYQKVLAERQKWKLTIQFKDAMEGLVAALGAGYSLEHAVSEALEDLKLMYVPEDIICQEFSYMERRVQLKVSVEELMKELGIRSGIQDIIMFSEILATAQISGGNLVEIMRQTSKNISEKIEIYREIETLIAGKKMEAGCMTAVPLLMIVYLRVFSPGFLDPLYHNLIGGMVMTGALVAYIAAFLWGQKIMKIQF